jgi:hypothetical protein
VSGVRALAYAARAAVDPQVASARGLTDRHGATAAARNDGSSNPQVTPIYLLTGALSAFDRSFDAFASSHPNDAQRLAQWRRARSQLVDQFLAVDAQANRFRDAALPRFVPIVVTALRQQLWAKCGEWPTASCAWAGRDLAQSASDSIGSPLFAHAMDLVDAIRRDRDARVELEKALSYLLDERSSSEALSTLLTASADGMQMLQDDANLVPIYHAIATALAPSAEGDRGLVDAQLSLLTRLTGRTFDASGVELCGRELDPNQVLTSILSSAVTPVAFDGGRTMAPIEVVLDAIADVNRSAPDDTGPLDRGDYASVADEVSQFLLDKERGLEQLYAVVKNAR